jgi:hypothetical protein
MSQWTEKGREKERDWEISDMLFFSSRKFYESTTNMYIWRHVARNKNKYSSNEIVTTPLQFSCTLSFSSGLAFLEPSLKLNKNMQLCQNCTTW